MIKQHHVPVSTEASYCTLNNLTEKTERVWLVFHGYGQLAHYFIKKFEILDPEKNFIIAPQGLSKYYLNGFYGRVGASWMTKEDRLTDIQNQYSYIDSVLKDAGDISTKKLIYFGFSQGTATMGRYAGHAKIPFEKMVIWAGTFPPDIESQEYDFLTRREEISYFTSKQDPFFKPEMVDTQNEVISKIFGMPPLLKWYEGEHTVIPELLKTI